ncbi:LysR substrate-binding domain-containing protein (plasmid) [Comamonadaceae bacterium OTU4NAUVB1]|nr:LysR substrate-binding domain-containing protein [Comamonadaceae bacterium OTU4NAUVB1]HSU22449.1 LysR substrate-binding domain-containing protein [Variovorax sp.]
MSDPQFRSLINLRQLEVLRAVMRCRTTIGAAEELGMSQPAVSNAIKLAETKLGIALFDRVSNRLVPTADARILMADAEPLFVVHEAVQRKAWDLRTGRAGVLRIHATAELSQHLVPPVLALFMAEHPDVQVTIESVRMDALLEGVESGSADIGIAMKPPARPSLVREVLIEAEMMCITPGGDALGPLPVLTPFDLRGRRLVGPGPASPLGAMIAQAFERSSDHYHPDIEARFANIVSPLVARGLGIGFVDEMTARQVLSPAFEVHRFRPRVAIPVCALFVRDKPRARLAQVFAQRALRYMQAQIGRRGGGEGEGNGGDDDPRGA